MSGPDSATATAPASGQTFGISPELIINGTPVNPSDGTVHPNTPYPMCNTGGQPNAPMLFPSGYLPQLQSVPGAHFGLSDSDVMRVALQCKLLISSDIDRLVKEEVDIATADLKNSVVFLKDEKENLRKCMGDCCIVVLRPR